MDDYKNRLCHIFNRGARKKIIFKDEEDYYKFLYCLKEYNTTLNATDKKYNKIHKKKRIGKTLVKNHSYAMIFNHFHLILEELRDGGVSLFMQKVSIAYTKYFNKKYKSKGVIFQGGYGHKNIKSFFDYIGRYAYVAGNSIIHGIVDDVRDYKWSNLNQYMYNQDGLCSYDLINSLGYTGEELINEVNRMSKLTYIQRLEDKYWE